MSLRNRQKGIALVELGITISLLVAIVFGITEFGRAIYQYNTIAKAARDAVRYLSTKAPGDLTAIEEARCFAVFGNPGCSGSPLAPELRGAMFSVCDATRCPGTHQSQGTAPVINLVTVTIGGYTFDSVFQFVLPDITFGPISATMRQVL